MLAPVRSWRHMANILEPIHIWAHTGSSLGSRMPNRGYNWHGDDTGTTTGS